MCVYACVYVYISYFSNVSNCVPIQRVRRRGTGKVTGPPMHTWAVSSGARVSRV